MANRVPSSEAVGGAQQAGASPNAGQLLSELNSSDGRATLVFLGFVSVSVSCSIHTLHARLRHTQRINRYWSCRNIQAGGVPGRFQRILVSHRGQGRLCEGEQGKNPAESSPHPPWRGNATHYKVAGRATDGFRYRWTYVWAWALGHSSQPWKARARGQ